jgi:hypothetical protein
MSCVLSAALGACGADDSSDGTGGAGGVGGASGSGGSSGSAGSGGSGATGGAAGSGGSGAVAGAAGAGGTDANAPCAEWLSALPQGSAAPLVHYSYGNQITGSRVNIFEDGTVEHSERASAGSDWQPVNETALSSAEIDQLKNQAQAVAGGGWSTTDGPPFALGAKTGLLCAVRIGQAYTVRALEIAGESDPMLDHRSTAPEASAIVSLVEGYAAEDMP